MILNSFGGVGINKTHTSPKSQSGQPSYNPFRLNSSLKHQLGMIKLIFRGTLISALLLVPLKHNLDLQDMARIATTNLV